MGGKDIVSSKRQADIVAIKIMELIRNSVFINMRYMDMALFSLDIKNDDMVFSIASDGKRLYFSTPYIITEYKKDSASLSRAFVHCALHCVFRHIFVDKSINKDIWNLACDIAVENIIDSIVIESLNSNNSPAIEAELKYFRSKLNIVTAERLYRYILNSNIDKNEIKRLSKLFARDNHSIWYNRKVESDLNEKWLKISERMTVDIETASGGDYVSEALRIANAKKQDYSRFLKRFACLNEELATNDDEFDYIYYTYGLTLYKNMPLIEPLEYKESIKINDFVIAIDTSASCSGDVVKEFIEKTYSILSNEESFFKKINVYIIQCDAEIQSVSKITNSHEFNEYIKNIVIKGYGNTDFRPLFSYVDGLIEKGELKNIKGLIYFTDGRGIFPSKKPLYETAFIFNDYPIPPLPPWAIGIVI